MQHAPSHQHRKKVRVPWFRFWFHGTKCEGTTQKTHWFFPRDNRAKLINSVLLHRPRDKIERNSVPCQKKRFFVVSSPKIGFWKGRFMFLKFRLLVWKSLKLWKPSKMLIKPPKSIPTKNNFFQIISQLQNLVLLKIKVPSFKARFTKPSVRVSG